MKKILAMILLCAAFCACEESKSSSPAAVSYQAQNVTSTTALAVFTYRINDMTGAKYGYTLETNQAAAQDPQNMGAQHDLYNPSTAAIDLTDLNPDTDYYSMAFLITGGVAYSSPILHFKTLAQ